MERVGRLSWRHLEPFGAELVSEAPLASLNEVEQAAVKRLFYDRQLLVLRGQKDLSREDQKRFCGFIDRVIPDSDTFSTMLDVDPNVGALGDYQLPWHRDMTYAEHPYSVIALYAVDVVDGQTSTFIASSVRAYERLPQTLKETIAPLQAMTVMGSNMSGRPREENCLGPDWPRRVKPLAQPHPVTGKLMVTPCYWSTLSIEDMDPEQGEELILDVLARAVVPENVYEHVWRKNDLFLWDNIGCLHARKPLEGVKKRQLQRVLCGTHSHREAFPDFDAIGAMRVVANKDYFGTFKDAS